MFNYIYHEKSIRKTVPTKFILSRTNASKIYSKNNYLKHFSEWGK